MSFDPRSIAGLAFWSHPSPTTVVTDAVMHRASRALDLSGHQGDAVQKVWANQPTYSATALNGGPALTFASGLSLNGPVLDFSTGMLLTVQLTPHSFSPFPFIADIDDGTDAGRRLEIAFPTDGQASFRIYQTRELEMGRRTAAGYVTTGSPVILSFAWDGTLTASGLAIYVNGTRADTITDSNGTVTAVPAAASALKVCPSLDADVGDFLFFTASVADADRVALETALQAGTLAIPAAPAQKWQGNIYVSATGSPTAAGTEADPVDFPTLGDEGVAPGSTVWLMNAGGTYTGQFDPYLYGTADQPVIVRNYNGERVTIDGWLHPHGAYTWYWGLEAMYSEPTRVSTQTTGDLSHPFDIPRVGHQFAPAADAGPYNKLINCVIHDLADGTGDDNPQGTEVSGCYVYNNGWIGTDRGHGHGVYTQNNTPAITKRYFDNVIFNNFSTGLTIHGNGDNLRGFDVEGGASFTSGGPTAGTFGYQRNLEIEGSTEMGDITLTGLSSFHFAATSSAIFAGNAGEYTNYPLTITNCITRGVVELNGWQGLTVTDNKMSTGPTALDSQSRAFRVRVKPGLAYANYTVDRQRYAMVPAPQANLDASSDAGTVSTSDLTVWRTGTGWDGNATYQASPFTGADVLVEPNRYETKRANVYCWNYDRVATLAVDLSGVLAVGDSYTIHHVYDLYGAPVVQGTYDGTPVPVPQTGFVAPTPIGWSAAPASASPDFNIFLVQGADSQEITPPPPPPPPPPTDAPPPPPPPSPPPVSTPLYTDWAQLGRDAERIAKARATNAVAAKLPSAANLPADAQLHAALTELLGGAIVGAIDALTQMAGDARYQLKVPSVYDDGQVSGAVTVDWLLGTTHRLTLTGNVTSLAIVNLPVGSSLTLEINTGAGGFTFTGGDWDTVLWFGGVAPTVTTTAARIDRFRFDRTGVGILGEVLGQGAVIPAASGGTGAGPATVTASASGTTMVLGWAAVTNATSYSLYRKFEQGGYIDATWTVVATPTGTSYSDTGLVQGATYHYYVTATVAGVETSPSPEVSATIPVATAGLPTAPTNVNAVPASSTEIDLSWTNTASNATAIEVHRGTTQNFTPDVAGGSTRVVSLGPTTTSYADTGRTAEETYYYYIIAVNAAGSAASAEVSATPPTAGSPPPPSSSFTNEPAGLTLLSDQPWTGLPVNDYSKADGYGWKRQDPNNSYSIVQDASVPMGGTYLHVQYNAGFPSGNGPGILNFGFSPDGLPNQGELFLASNIWVSQDAVTTGAHVWKLWYVYQEVWSPTYNRQANWIALRPSNGTAGPFEIALNEESWGAGAWLNHNGTGPHYAITYETWHRIEMYIKRSSADGVADGIYRLWVDGVLYAEYTTCQFAGAPFTAWHVDPVWGGGAGETMAAPQVLRYDRMYLSGTAV